jgi:hypothetical protein
MALSAASTQAQASLIAIRLANDSQRAVVDLLAANVQQNANPEHLGNLVDTSA